MISAPRDTPTPMPALALVFRPPLLLDEVTVAVAEVWAGGAWVKIVTVAPPFREAVVSGLELAPAVVDVESDGMSVAVKPPEEVDAVEAAAV